MLVNTAQFMSKEIHVVVGARPNQNERAPLLRVLRSSEVTPYLVDTGQHYDHEMAGIFFEQFGMGTPDIALNVGSGSHGKQTANILERYEAVLLERQPDCVIVIGDVNSTVACARLRPQNSVFQRCILRLAYEATTEACLKS